MGLVLVVVVCTAVLFQFHGVICDNHEHEIVDRDTNSDDRTRRYHESDCIKARLRQEQNKDKNIGAAVGPSKKVPILKVKTPINERNEPEDVKTINHILEEIAQIAQAHNETKGIKKIRHLVDEIDKQDDIKYEPKQAKSNPVKVQLVKTPKKDQSIKEAKIILKSVNDTKVYGSVNKLPNKCQTVLKITAVAEPKKLIKNKDVVEIKVVKPVASGSWSNSECEYVDKTSSRKNMDIEKHVKNENIIEIKEHNYEEESLRVNPYKYTQADTYMSWYMWYSYPGYYNGYTCTRNPNDIENYYDNCLAYPTSTYENYMIDDGGYSYDYFNTNSPESVQATTEGDYTRLRKTWLDRNTVIATGDPKNHHTKSLNEDKNEITNVKYPDFERKYCSVSQKQYFNNMGMVNNQYSYYVNPNQCS